MKKKLTLTERQLKALYALTRGDAPRGARYPVAQARDPERRTDDKATDKVTVESHLTHSEMVDMDIRLREYLFPFNLGDHEHEVVV
jgi:hypothetical protein